MADLKTTYVDDILNTSKNTKRKYNMIANSDGTVSFEDVTDYSQEGDSFGAADVNAITAAINQLNSDLNSLNDRYAEQAVGTKSGRKIIFDGSFSAIVSFIGRDAASYGAFIVQGYGAGSSRIHVTSLQSGASIQCTIKEDEEAVFLNNNTSDGIISVFMLYGDLPIFTIDY